MNGYYPIPSAPSCDCTLYNPCHGPVGYSYQYNRFATREISQQPPELSPQEFYTLWRILDEVDLTTNVAMEVQVLVHFPIELGRLIFEQYARLARMDYLASKGEEEYSVGEYITRYGQPLEDGRYVRFLHKGLTSLNGLELLSTPEMIERLDFGNNFISNYYDTALDPYVQYVTRNPSPFRKLLNLTELELSNNELWSLPEGAFEELTRLEYLNLASNQFSMLPERLFAGLGSLKRLNLSYNQLSKLSDRVFEGVELRSLVIDNNYLKGTEQEFKSKYGLAPNVVVSFYPQRIRKRMRSGQFANEPSKRRRMHSTHQFW